MSYHTYTDLHYIDGWWATDANGEVRQVNVEKRDVDYHFSNHFHPFIGDVLVGEDRHLVGLTTRLLRSGIRALERADTARVDGGDVLVDPTDAELYDGTFFETYDPTSEVVGDRPVKDLDFSSGGAYSVYNWELFFHIPLTIAIHLSRNQRFQEAQRWLHLLFDPTDDRRGPTPERFWKVKPFQLTEIQRIETILVNLATGDDPALLEETVNAIHEWKDKPFRPHVVARHRHSAYMYKTVMAYLDNLIAWGDHLFRQDTRESINDATQLYVLAANLLGPRPQEVPKRGEIRPRSYADIRAQLNEFGTVLQDIETTLPFGIYPIPNTAGNDDQAATLASIGMSLYFCVPRNDKLLEYWDTVADRLFKIRNSLNIRGVFRQLPLFEPPIDPAMLARAAAAGLDVSAVIAGLNQPLPLVRFQFLINKATELASEVRALGATLLSAIEKEDAEALAILRSAHERAILDLTESVRYAQWQEAIKAREGLERSLGVVIRRYTFYERLLGMDENDVELPEMDDLDVQQLVDGRLRSDEPEVTPREIDVQVAQGDLFEAAGHFLSPEEALELQLQNMAEQPLSAAMAVDAVTAILHYLPTVTAAAHPFGAGVDVTWGTANITGYLSSLSGLLKSSADVVNRRAARVGRVAGYGRREQDWAFQSGLAAGEIGATLKQLRAAQIREFIAKREYESHQKQIVQAEEIADFLTDERRGKTTNKNLYSWMRREVQALHSQSFQLAFDVAKKAERALQHELGDTDLTYLKYNYPSGKEGLLAGEKLHLDLKRMEIDYHDRNRREYELTRNISLLQVNPLGLLQLRMTGRCTLTLPEELFDLDGPGHYFRRIKSVAITVPSVTGPYVNVNSTLRLVNSTIRTSAILLDGEYARTDPDDARFNDHLGSLDAVVTSSGQSDTGMFQTDLNDQRYLPFEGAGVISEWQLELPANPANDDPSQFDYQTITDVILQLRYTAREGGALLRDAALTHLKTRIDEAEAVGSTRMFSIRHEFPTEWARFTSTTIDNTTPRAPLTLTLKPEHYPFWSRGRLGELKRMTLIAHTTSTTLEISNTPDPNDPGTHTYTLTQPESLGNLWLGDVTDDPLPAPTGELTLYLSDTGLDDLWLLATWGANT
jgi:beta-phosphoglucomutase-like phosphatase (HAD superfamily)